MRVCSECVVSILCARQSSAGALISRNLPEPEKYQRYIIGTKPKTRKLFCNEILSVMYLYYCCYTGFLTDTVLKIGCVRKEDIALFSGANSII